MALCSQMLRDGYRVRLRVSGSSMAPFLKSGSYVTLLRAPLGDLEIGDIIFCSRTDGTFLLHRLIATDSATLQTKGDALDLPDPPFDKGDYLGKVVHIEHRRHHAVAHRSMDRRSARAANYCIAVSHRLKLHLVRKLISKSQQLFAGKKR